MEAQFGGKLGSISCFSKVLPFPSYVGGSVLATRVQFLSGTTWMPPVCGHSSIPLVSESAPAGAALPSGLPTMDRKLGRAAHKYDEGELEASHAFSQYSLNFSVSGTARGSQYQSRCHCGHEGGHAQFTASVKMTLSNWPFLGYPKGVKSRRITCICLANIL